MSNETFAELFQDKTVSRTTLQPGSRVEATVVGISGDTIFLDAGGKSEGILNAAELRDQAGALAVAPGDRVQVFFLSMRGGEMLFTTRLGSGQTSSRELEEAFHAGIPIEGKVTGEVKGGFSVTVAGQRGFCPYSQMDIRKIEHPEEYLDKSLAFKVIEFGNQGRNIILSARAVLEEQRQQEREQLKARLHEGMQVKGIVTSIRPFGAFVDIGGVDGLIPIAELAWGQTDRVEDVLSRDQQVEVVIKRLDWDNERISLSLRETLENPWDKVTQRYPEGSVHQGTVSRLTAFGAFVTLEPGVDGLLHISRLGAGKRIHHPREVVSVGQEMTVKVESIDVEQKRLALVPEDYTAKESVRDAAPAPPIARESPSMGTLGDLLHRQMRNKKR
ncbi:MAG: 30S ribosomal protein S1 [Proteobacteria bacterium]|nr:30S ribosomal protein S1 [Pseudomonadota bacterium]